MNTGDLREHWMLYQSNSNFLLKMLMTGLLGVFVVDARAAENQMPYHRGHRHLVTPVAKGGFIGFFGNSSAIFDHAVCNEITRCSLASCRTLCHSLDFNNMWVKGRTEGKTIVWGKESLFPVRSAVLWNQRQLVIGILKKVKLQRLAIENMGGCFSVVKHRKLESIFTVESAFILSHQHLNYVDLNHYPRSFGVDEGLSIQPGSFGGITGYFQLFYELLISGSGVFHC